MKLRIFLLAILTILSSEFYGQAISNSGFVFINGKYVDAPYQIYTKDMAVYINGHQITKQLEWPVVNKNSFDHDPGIPITVTRNTSLEEASQMREPTNNVLFHAAKQWYLFTHYDYKTAEQMTQAYFESLPYVKSLTKSVDGAGWIMESYSGEIRRIMFGGPRMEMLNSVWGPNGTGPPLKQELLDRLKEREKRYKSRLDKGDLFIISSPDNEVSYSKRKAAVLLPEMINIIDGGGAVNEKYKELISIGLIPRVNVNESKTFIKNCKVKSNLRKRVNDLVEDIRKDFGEPQKIIRDYDLKMRELKKQKFIEGGNMMLKTAGAAYSPDGKVIYAGCAHTYEAGFNFPEETQPIVDDIKDQDYNATMIQYKDDTDQDNNAGSMTYANFKNMKYADVLYWTCHGGRSSGLWIIRLQSKAAVNTWSGNDSTNIIPLEETNIDWPTGHPWEGFVKSSWATNNWNSILTQSKAITILSCCYSFQNGWAAACGGGVAFGYDTTCYSSNNIKNDRDIFQYMSGKKGGGSYRKAGEAFNKMSIKRDRFRITPANAQITLAPGTQDFDPADGELVSNTGSGYFEVDTWCHDNVPATEALTFVTNGNVVISNIQWDGTGKVKKITFDWVGDACWDVTLTAQHTKWLSWGAATTTYHKLDANRVTPNTSNGSLTFYSDDSLSVSVVKTDVLCYKGSDGTATATVTNGTPPYTYDWSPSGGSGATASGLKAGTYTVRVTDANNCHASENIIITQPTFLNISISYYSVVKYCIQDGPTVVTFTATGVGGTPPYLYSWPGGSIQVSSSGKYTCVVTDANGCTQSHSVLVKFIPILCSRDPNDIAGATGHEPGNWVSVNDVLPYTIRFENDPEFASAPAQKVVVTLPFDDNINPFSFKLSNFGFGSFNFTVPPNSIFYSDRLDVVDSLGVYVDVLAGIDVTENEAFWIFESVDPATGLPPTNALSGFLPVNDTITHIGEGFVSYTVEPKITSQTGDSIHATAEIVFDINESIFTNTWKNVIDAVAPTSVMDTFPSFSIVPEVDLTWQATDDIGGVGVGSYDLFMAKDGATFSLYMSNLDTNYYRFNGSINSSYDFYVLAIDYTGNREPDKGSGEGSIQMGEPTITALTPQFADIYCDNDSILISWETVGVIDFTLFISTDDGVTYDSITTLFSPIVNEYWWPVAVSYYGDSCIVKITDADQTIEELSRKFAISESPIVNLGTDIIIGLGDVLTIDAGAGFATYTWNDGSITQTIDVIGANGAGVFNYDIVVADNYGCMGIDDIVVTIQASDTCNQDIILPNGWSIFSTYVYPHNPDIQVVLAGIVNNVILAKDELGQVYWAFFGLNQIGNMTIGKGYQIKVVGVNTVQVSGECTSPESIVLSLTQGWSILGYLRQTPAPIITMMSPLGSDLLFIKNGDGMVYWPVFNLDLIGNMMPGEAYQINMLVLRTYSYPANPENYAKAETIPIVPVHFYPVRNTGSNMTLVIPKTVWGEMPEYGAEVGAFNSSNELVGYSVVNENNIAITIWGNDNYSEDIDGLKENESFNLRIWNPVDNQEYELFISEWETGNSNYVQNSYSIAAKVEIGEVILEEKVLLYQNSPNPFKESTILSFYLPVDMEVEISIYGLLGNKISDFNVSGIYTKGYHEIEFTPVNLSSGSYLCKLTTINGIQTQVINLVR